jgi:cold shock CspA family protein
LGHFSAIEMEDYKTLTPGRTVEVDVEGPLPFEQDGFRYRAQRVRPFP